MPIVRESLFLGLRCGPVRPLQHSLQPAQRNFGITIASLTINRNDNIHKRTISQAGMQMIIRIKLSTLFRLAVLVFMLVYVATTVAR